MFTLIIRFFDILLIIAGAVMAVVGTRSLTGRTEEAPTEVSIAALEKGEKPEARWLKISDGELFFSGTAKDVKIRKGEKSDGEGFYIPMGSKQQVLQWSLSELTGKPSLKNCRVLVVVDRSIVAEKWPEMLAGNPPKNPGTFTAEGTIVAGTDASTRLQKFYNEKYSDLDLSQLSVLSNGDKPLQKGGAALLLGCGTGMVILGVLVWRVKRHRRVAALTPPVWSTPPVTGMPPGYPQAPGYPGMPGAPGYAPPPQQHGTQAPPPFPPQ